MLKLHMIAATGLAAASLAASVPAQAQSITASNTQTVAGFLKSQGLSVETTTDDDGDPIIETSFGENEKFSVYFYDCTDGRNCGSVQFYAGYSDSDADAALLNTWNRTKRFGRAYIDNTGDPVVEMDLNLTGTGISRELFASDFELWHTLMDEFSSFIY